MSLLRDIQNDAVSKDVDVSATLRKCMLLAARLDSQQFEQWINWESDGYPKDVKLPEYRTLRNLPVKGHFDGGFGLSIRFANIPSLNIPENIRFACTSVDLRNSISSIEHLARNANGKLHSPVSADLVVLFADRVFEGYGCMSAWREIPDTAIHEVLNTVRNRVLDFALKIERLNASAGEAELGRPAIPRGAVTQVFNTTIHGTGNVVTQGAGTSATARDVTVFKHTIEQSSLDDKIKDVLVEAWEALELLELPTAEREDAAEQLGKLADELIKPDREGGRLRRYWNRIKDVAPTVADILKSAEVIAKFTGAVL